MDDRGTTAVSAMTRIVTTHYRYKRPPQRKKPVAIEAPEVVTVRDSKRARRSDDGTTDQKPSNDASGPTEKVSDDRTLSANDDRKPAIVTIQRKSRFVGRAEDLTVDARMPSWPGACKAASGGSGSGRRIPTGAPFAG